MAEQYDKWIRFNPAFDKRHTDPKKDYGIHCVDVTFFLRGKEGAVQFSVFSGWFLPETVKEYKYGGRDLGSSYPMATDLGYHSYVPKYEGQNCLIKKCPILHDKPCYYDGSGLNAEPVMDRLLKEGSDAVWEELEKFYIEMFKKEKK